MLPPVLEVYVVWHPGDEAGEQVAELLIDHFHGDAFSGLIGGAVEVFVRSEGWEQPGGAPRPLPVVSALPNELREPALTVVVPVLGTELGAAVEPRSGSWHGYLAAAVDARNARPEAVAIVPVSGPGTPASGTLLELVGPIQGIVAAHEDLCRDLSQAIAQFLIGDDEVLKVFISHTKHADDPDELAGLLEDVRREIRNSRLSEFFDASDLQVGRDWAPELVAQSATSALLAVRTDLYATRAWCQRELLTAKRAGMPVVILDTLSRGEDRGSFLMDHVPRIPGAPDRGTAIRAALSRLVDECLKRALWSRQRQLVEAEGVLDVAWWAPHAPEPITMLHWLQTTPDDDEPLLVLHPDPPLGTDELKVLAELAATAGIDARLEITTPRGLATRGG
jgi:hypothetical protein